MALSTFCSWPVHAVQLAVQPSLEVRPGETVLATAVLGPLTGNSCPENVTMPFVGCPAGFYCPSPAQRMLCPAVSALWLYVWPLKQPSTCALHPDLAPLEDLKALMVAFRAPFCAVTFPRTTLLSSPAATSTLNMWAGEW